MVDLGIPGFSRFEEIGRGGSSRVYRCRQARFDRVVALKLLADDALGDDTRTTFERECQAVGNLAWHPNIITVYGAGVTTDGMPYLTMEYAPNGSLAARVAERGRLPEPEVVEIGIRIASALDALHRAGVLHRDVKPGNVLLSSTDEPLLADLGIASVAGAATTTLGAGAATIAHAAPELLEGEAESAQSDIYSLGSTLFTLLAGHPP